MYNKMDLEGFHSIFGNLIPQLPNENITNEKDKIFVAILDNFRHPLLNDLNFGITFMPFIWWQLEN
jgi:hypothetical protein